MSDRLDKTALSYWFPLIEAAGLPAPKTLITTMPREAMEAIFPAFDGLEPKAEHLTAHLAFVDKLIEMGREVGFPCFLRTDHTSGKHEWERTCYVNSEADMRNHVFSIIEYSEMCSLVGVPWGTWVVREFLPTMPLGTCPNYGNMPLCREFRFFVGDGEVRCWHPYWPLESLEQGGADTSLFDRLSAAPEDYKSLHELAHRTARALEGSWSVDILETKRGWYVTDMAEAHKSFHWEGCEETSYARPV